MVLTKDLKAEALLMLTDVPGVSENWGQVDARSIRRVSPDALRKMNFPAATPAE